MFEKLYLKCSSFVPSPLFEALLLIVLGLAFLSVFLALCLLTRPTMLIFKTKKPETHFREKA